MGTWLSPAMKADDARLVFDSDRNRDRLGARGGLRPDPVLLYHSNTLAVDIMFLPIEGPEKLQYVQGQVLKSAWGSPVEGARVRADPESKGTLTDQFGQFFLTSRQGALIRELLIEAEEETVVCQIPEAAN